MKTGALLSAQNHAWFNKQSLDKQEQLNRIFQDYKLGLIEIKNGKVLQSDWIKLDNRDYFVIPLQPDNRIYNRSKVKRETEKAIEGYYEGDR